MSRLNCLDLPLFKGVSSSPLPLELREAIMDQFWGIASKRPIGVDAYFTFYQNACESQFQNEHAMETHRHLLDIVSHLKKERAKNRAQIRQSLCTSNQHFQNYSSTRVDKSLELGIRLWLMVCLSSVGSFIPGQTKVFWLENQTYTDVLERTFPKAIGHDSRRLEFSAALTMFNLVRIGGFRIKWTCNLVDHLVLNKQGQVLVYHLIGPLEALAESGYLPNGLEEETLRTLALLFPRANIPARDWLDKVIAKARDRNEYIKPGIGDLKTTSLDVESFSYWKHRLLVLEAAFDRSEPATLHQWWYDRRRRREWATFWVAFLVLVLTIIFGLIQSITGIVQAYAAVKGLKLQISGA